jgi:photoactive yellow protein
MNLFTDERSGPPLKEAAPRRGEATPGLLDTLGIPVFLIAAEDDGDFRFDYVNADYADRLRLSPEMIAGRRIADVLLPEQAKAMADHCRRCVVSGAGVDYQEEVLRSGVRFFWRTRLKLLVEPGATPRIVGTSIDVTDRKRLEYELSAARDQAERSSQSKTHFLTNMSHELRTPLNAIIGFSEMISSEILGPVGVKTYAEYAGDIHFAGSHLLGIVNDVLEMARIEAGKVDAANDEIPLGTLLGGAERIIKERAMRSRLTLRVLDAPSGVSVIGDERLLRQALINVVGNSVKFTEGGGTVELAAHVLADGQICFTVSDTGIGISAQDLPVALAPFGRIAPPTTAEREGTGLGLPITKAVVELHGGQIFVNSQVGVGTTVFLTLPADRLRTADRQPPRATIAGLNEFFTFDGRHVTDSADGLSEAELDQLPVGAILLDSNGRVLRYNEAEARFTGLHPMAVVGRDFFRDIAPCTFTPEFHGRFRAGGGDDAVSTLFSYIFRIGKQPAKVLVEMRAAKELKGVWLFIRWA